MTIATLYTHEMYILYVYQYIVISYMTVSVGSGRYAWLDIARRTRSKAQLSRLVINSCRWYVSLKTVNRLSASSEKHLPFALSRFVLDFGVFVGCFCVLPFRGGWNPQRRAEIRLETQSGYVRFHSSSSSSRFLKWKLVEWSFTVGRPARNATRRPSRGHKRSS